MNPVAGDDWESIEENPVAVTENKAKETRVKDGLKENGDGGLDELHFQKARDV